MKKAHRIINQKVLFTFLFVAAIAMTSLVTPFTQMVKAADGSTFSDVPANDHFYGYIEDLASQGIINGYEGGAFKPNNNVTRGQAAKMIAVGAGLDYEGKAADFSDVSKDSEFSPYIAALVKDGAIKGYPDKTFRMNKSITRRQMAQIIVEAFDLVEGDDEVAFTDLSKDDIATGYINVLASNGIIEGYENGTQYKPSEPTTRAQFAKILSEAMTVSGRVNTGVVNDSKENEVVNDSKVNEVVNDSKDNEKDSNPITVSIMVDPGHGGSDPGALNNNLKIEEADVNLAIGLKVRAKLQDEGYNVVMTRTEDQAVELNDRSSKANAAGTDIFVSIHCNAFSNENVNGIETFHYPGSSSGEKLATCIQKQVIAHTGAYDRGVKSADFSVLRRTSMPAALIECGFITNSEEGNSLNNSSYQNTLANAIVAGINDYFGK